MASCISLAIGLSMHHLPCNQRRLHFVSPNCSVMLSFVIRLGGAGDHLHCIMQHCSNANFIVPCHSHWPLRSACFGAFGNGQPGPDRDCQPQVPTPLKSDRTHTTSWMGVGVSSWSDISEHTTHEHNEGLPETETLSDRMRTWTDSCVSKRRRCLLGMSGI